MGGASLVYSVFFIFSVYVATGLATVSSYFLIHKVTVIYVAFTLNNDIYYI